MFYVYPSVFTVTDGSGAISLPQSPLAPAPVVMRAEYNRIQEGMTYVQMREIIGRLLVDLAARDAEGVFAIVTTDLPVDASGSDIYRDGP